MGSLTMELANQGELKYDRKIRIGDPHITQPKVMKDNGTEFDTMAKRKDRETHIRDLRVDRKQPENENMDPSVFHNRFTKGTYDSALSVNDGSGNRSQFNTC